MRGPASLKLFVTILGLGSIGFAQTQTSGQPPANTNFPADAGSRAVVVPGAPIGGAAAPAQAPGGPAGAAPRPQGVPGNTPFIQPGIPVPGNGQGRQFPVNNQPSGAAVFNGGMRVGTPPPAPNMIPPSAPGGVSTGRALRPGEPAALSITGQPSPSLSIEAPPCDVVVHAGEVPVKASGGNFQVAGRLEPAGCVPNLATTSDWLRAGVSAPGAWEFSASPNSSRNPREAVVVVGDQKILITQEGTPGPQFAVSPGHISMQSDGEHSPKSQTLSVFSEDAKLTYAVSSPYSWLKISPDKSTQGAHKFKVTVDPERLRMGRNEGYLLVSAAGMVDEPLRIPVTVELPRLR